MGRETLSPEEIAYLLQGDRTDSPQATDAASANGPAAETDEHARAASGASPAEEERMIRLRALSAQLAYNLSGAFSKLFRAATQVDVGNIDNVTYPEFLLYLNDPTCFVTVRTKDERAQFALNIEPAILFPMIERMLGGDLGTAAIERWPLTEIERRLAVRIVELFLDQWKAVSKPFDELAPEIVSVDSSPCRTETLACKEAVTRIQFEMALGHSHGAVWLVIPQSLADNCQPCPGDTKRRPATPGDSSHHDPVHVAVLLTETRLPAADVNDLQIGDVIDTEKGVDAPLEVTLDGVPRLEGKPGMLNGHKAVRIEQS